MGQPNCKAPLQGTTWRVSLAVGEAAGGQVSYFKNSSAEVTPYKLRQEEVSCRRLQVKCTTLLDTHIITLQGIIVTN